MTPRRTHGLLITLLSAGLLTACTSTAGGDAHGNDTAPTNDDEPSTARTSTQRAGQAPPIDEPLDVSTLTSEPCSALSETQRDELNLKSGKVKEGSTGPYCKYRYRNDSGNLVTVGVSNRLPQGLDSVYGKRENLEVFESTTIAGYPAVYAAQHDQREQGLCQLYVGVTDTNVVRLMAQLYPDTHDYPRGCEVAELTAETMIEHLSND